jgi:hypothetical protein
MCKLFETETNLPKSVYDFLNYNVSCTTRANVARKSCHFEVLSVERRFGCSPKSNFMLVAKKNMADAPKQQDAYTKTQITSTD